jgi:hypothetical protein
MTIRPPAFYLFASYYPRSSFWQAQVARSKVFPPRNESQTFTNYHGSKIQLRQPLALSQSTALAALAWLDMAAV